MVLKIAGQVFSIVVRARRAVTVLMLSLVIFAGLSGELRAELEPCHEGIYGAGGQFDPKYTACIHGKMCSLNWYMCLPGPNGGGGCINPPYGGSCYSGGMCPRGLTGCITSQGFKCSKFCTDGRSLTPSGSIPAVNTSGGNQPPASNVGNSSTSTTPTSPNNSLTKTASPPLILSKPGYYLIKKTGAGWRKLYGNSASLISGYRYILIYIDPKIKAMKKGYSYYSYPVGTDFNTLSAEWVANARETAVKYCGLGARTCPCGSEPDIYANGPVYELVTGPFVSKAVLTGSAGLHPSVGTATNGDDTWFRWSSENRKYSEATEFCESLE